MRKLELTISYLNSIQTRRFPLHSTSERVVSLIYIILQTAVDGFDASGSVVGNFDNVLVLKLIVEG